MQDDDINSEQKGINQQGLQFELIKWQNRQNINQYLIFCLTDQNKLLTQLHELKTQFRQKQFLQLYCEIEGKGNQYKKNLLYKKEMLCQTLQNNIIEFGGQFFYGNNSSLHTGNKIRLKLSHIQNINFKNLKYMHFQQCNLESVQILAWLDIKQLEKLSLIENNISSLKPLGKTSLSKLTHLFLSYNKLSYTSNIYLPRFHSKKLEYISIYPHKYQKNNNCSEPQLKILLKTEVDIKRPSIAIYKLGIYSNGSIQDLKKTRWIKKQIFILVYSSIDDLVIRNKKKIIENEKEQQLKNQLIKSKQSIIYVFIILYFVFQMLIIELNNILIQKFCINIMEIKFQFQLPSFLWSRLT